MRVAEHDRDVVPWSVFFASLVAFFVAWLAGVEWLRLVLKPVPVLALAAWVSLVRTPLARTVLVGLLLGAVGDVLLETGNTAHFLPGLVAFLVGHVAYVVGFAREAPGWHWARLAPFVLLVVTVLLVTVPGLGAFAAPVVLYGCVIGLLLWRAAARVGVTQPAWLAWLGLCGAALFAASDALIAVNRFVAPFTGAKAVILVTYWAAQALLTLSVRRASVTGTASRTAGSGSAPA